MTADGVANSATPSERILLQILFEGVRRSPFHRLRILVAERFRGNVIHLFLLLRLIGFGGLLGFLRGVRHWRALGEMVGDAALRERDENSSFISNLLGAGLHIPHHRYHVTAALVPRDEVRRARRRSARCTA